MSANREDTLKQFCDVTGADEGRSKFFLESSNWQLEVALSSFYEHGGNAADEAAAPMDMPAQVLSDSDMDSPPGSPVRPQKKDKKPKNTGNQKFATLSSLQQDGSSSEDEEGQAFYAGGSERSGQQILGPGKGRNDIVTQMFKSVRERGAVMFDDEASSGSRGGGGLFSGTGYRLGQTADDHEVAANPQNPAEAQRNVSVRLRLYRTGFTIDDGELREYANPENAHMLDCIRRGEIPPELASSGAEVRVSLEDRRFEECPRQTSAKKQAFTGKGQMLGSPTPPVVGATVPIAADESDRAANEKAAQDAIAVNDKLPTTTVQIRLSDGTRLTGRFNLTHTVGDIRRYVTLAVPSYSTQQFALQTSYPSMTLDESEKTIENANLVNSLLVVRPL